MELPTSCTEGEEVVSVDKHTIMRKGKKLGVKEWVSPRGQGEPARMPHAGAPAHHFPSLLWLPAQRCSNRQWPAGQAGNLRSDPLFSFYPLWLFCFLNSWWVIKVTVTQTAQRACMGLTATHPISLLHCYPVARPGKSG